MAQVVLLKTIVVEIAEARDTGACLFKFVIGLKLAKVVEIVVCGKVLPGTDFMIEAHGELV